MTLEEQFEKETKQTPYIFNDLRPEIPTGYYVEWLEEKLNKLKDEKIY